MTPGRLRSLVKKEILDVMRNRAALVPVALVALVSLGLPFLLAVILPVVTGQPLGEDRDLARVSLAIGTHPELSANARIQLFLFQQFLIVFLLIPITGAMALAAHSVVGEKLARTLEPLLATPVTTAELLLSKVLGAVLPTSLISLIALVVYAVCIGLFAEAGVLSALVSLRSAVLVCLVGPGAALVALQAAVLISSRVSDPRTAQQFGVLVILPLTGLLIAQFTGTIWLSVKTFTIIGVGLIVLWLLLLLVSVALFDRETIVTRWK